MVDMRDIDAMGLDWTVGLLDCPLHRVHDRVDPVSGEII